MLCDESNGSFLELSGKQFSLFHRASILSVETEAPKVSYLTLYFSVKGSNLPRRAGSTIRLRWLDVGSGRCRKRLS
jgi:hypothetical protein